MRRRLKILVVAPDRALRASLSYLLGLEPDLEVRDCSPREVTETIHAFRPEVVLASEACRLCALNGARLLSLRALAPYEELLDEVRSAV